jgi:hypothetical protein
MRFGGADRSLLVVRQTLAIRSNEFKQNQKVNSNFQDSTLLQLKSMKQQKKKGDGPNIEQAVVI